MSAEERAEELRGFSSHWVPMARALMDGATIKGDVRLTFEIAKALQLTDTEAFNAGVRAAKEVAEAARKRHAEAYCEAKAWSTERAAAAQREAEAESIAREIAALEVVG